MMARILQASSKFNVICIATYISISYCVAQIWTIFWKGFTAGTYRVSQKTSVPMLFCEKEVELGNRPRHNCSSCVIMFVAPPMSSVHIAPGGSLESGLLRLVVNVSKLRPHLEAIF